MTLVPQSITVSSVAQGTSSLDERRFESLILRLRGVIDVAGCWSPILSILEEHLCALEASRGHLIERLNRLTPAERALTEVILQGYSNREAAVRLDKCERTVKQQLTSIYQKMGVASRSQLIALPRQLGARAVDQALLARLNT